MSRRETIDCDVCAEPIHVTRSGQPSVSLTDICVVLNIQALKEHAVFKDPENHVRAHDAGVNENLHVCFDCAAEHMSGWGPFETFAAAGTALQKTEPPAAAAAEPNEKLANINRFLNVVVEQIGDDRTEHVLSPQSEAANSRNQRAPLVMFPVGSIVSVEVASGQRPTVEVVAYQVKTKAQLKWDTVPPMCGKCDKETTHGERVTLRDAGDNAYEAICERCSEG